MLGFLKYVRTSRAFLARLFARDCGILFGVATTVLSFLSWEDVGVVGLTGKASAVAILLTVAFVASVVELCLRKTKTVWSNGCAEISVGYGDLFGLAAESRCMCVIPVNDAFDTQVDEPGSVLKPLVSPRTLHGQWVDKVLSSGLSLHDIDAKIDDALAETSVGCVRERARGKGSRYPIGTVAPFIAGGTSYLLTAVSQFDEDNVARSTVQDVAAAIASALACHNRIGQGCDLLIPLIGTGMSRAHLSHADALNLVLSECMISHEILSGRIRIVVYEGDRSKVSIWDAGFAK